MVVLERFYKKLVNVSQMSYYRGKNTKLIAPLQVKSSLRGIWGNILNGRVASLECYFIFYASVCPRSGTLPLPNLNVFISRASEQRSNLLKELYIERHPKSH